MSGQPKALSRLARAAPTFRPPWRGLFGKAPNPSDSLAELAEHLGTPEVRHKELSATLEAAEHLLSRRASDPEGAHVAWDFIEDLQLLASFPDTALRPVDVEPLLGPLGRSQWDTLDEQWQTVAASLSVSASDMTLDRYRTLSDPRVIRLFRSTYRVMPDGRMVGLSDVLKWEAGPR